MKRALLLIALAALAACSAEEEALEGFGSLKRAGRYSGVGLYGADELWRQLTPAPTAENPQAARLDDDTMVIAVVDSQTGEVRQCGNYSGHCIAMNPWAKPLPATQKTPAPLAKHAVDLEAEEQARDAATAGPGK